MTGIYCIENTINHYKYVGKSETSIESRALWINEATKTPKHLRNEYLTNAVQKYGIQNFKAYVLEECPPESCCEREMYWIAELKTYAHDPDSKGYNLTRGGDGISGYHHTEENKHRQSAMMKGNKFAVGSNGHLGFKFSEESKKKLSESLKGRVAHNRGIPMKESQRVQLSAIKVKYYEDHPESRKRFGELVSERNSNSCWITNGEENLFVLRADLDNYPGYKPGRTLSNSSKKGKIFINNGEINRQISSMDPITEGWVKGMLKRSGWKKGVHYED